MTKQNIVNIVSDATGLTKVETEAVMNGVMSTIIESLGKNERLSCVDSVHLVLSIVNQKSSKPRNWRINFSS